MLVLGYSPAPDRSEDVERELDGELTSNRDWHLVAQDRTANWRNAESDQSYFPEADLTSCVMVFALDFSPGRNDVCTAQVSAPAICVWGRPSGCGVDQGRGQPALWGRISGRKQIAVMRRPETGCL